MSYSIKLGKEPNVFTVNDLSSKQAVDQARELKAGNIKFGIYASDGTQPNCMILSVMWRATSCQPKLKARKCSACRGPADGRLRSG